MKRILFTKEFSVDELKTALGDDFQFESHDFIQTKEYDWSQIEQEIDATSSNFIISSVRSARLIKDLSRSSQFYIVGEKSKEILEKAGYHVAHCALYAVELVDFIKNNFKEKTSFNFLCSQIRRDTIPESLKSLGHEVNEIIAYETTNRNIQIIGDFDAYVFYSPSGVNSFVEQYGIAEKGRIFAIGKTTADAVEESLGRKAEFPDRPDNDSLIQFIKTRLNAEK